jgi:flagellar biosynthesis protein
MKSRPVEQSEGSPSSKGRQVSIRAQRGERAVALQYLEEQATPKVLASARGELAELIIQIAQKNNIPVLKDSSLAEILSRLQVGEILSSQFYEVIAEIVGFLYELEKETEPLLFNHKSLEAPESNTK